MYTTNQIRELFGNEVLKYLQDKNRGGISGEKGNTYENFYAIYQIALLAQQIIETNQEINFSSQIFVFVDDLIIDRKGSTPLQHYQLKNSTSVSWGSGLKSIADDFNKQQVLNQSVSRDSELHLVVSNLELRDKLNDSLPEAIKSFSQVLYFPYESNLMRVIAQQLDFHTAIEYLCAFENADPDKVECVAMVLLGAWASSGKSGVSIIWTLDKKK